MDVQFSIHRMNPDPGTICWQPNFRRSGDHGKDFRLHTLIQLSYMYMSVALRPPFHTVVRDSPLFAPERFSPGDGSGPKLRTIVRVQIRQRVGPLRVFPGKREGAIRLGWVLILKEEDTLIQRLLLCLTAEGTIHSFHGFRLGGIASAIAHVRQDKG